MRVSVVGTGYVGLVTGLGLAEMGHEAECVDWDEAKVTALNRGDAPILEEGLDELLRRHLGARFRATTDLEAAVSGSELTFVCVGTPSRGDGGIDVSYVARAAEQVGAILARKQAFHAVVVKSTVVPGTTTGMVAPALERASNKRAGTDFGVGVNPEFLTEGQAIDDFLHPDRIVMGGDERTVAALRELYADFDGVPLLITNTSTAEMIKYASNAMLATAISFANEIANLGSAIGGIDAVEVMRGLHLSRYLTTPAGHGRAVTALLSAFFEAGCGYGGSCLPKDVAALAVRGREVGSPLELLEAVARVNENQPRRLVAVLRRELGELRGRRIVVLGLAFKPDTDDTRCSPAFSVIQLLLEAGAELVVHDPVVGPEVLDRFGGQALCHIGDLATAVKGADAIVIVTRWDHYRRLPDIIVDLDPPPLVVDGRRILDKRSLPLYTGIGL